MMQLTPNFTLEELTVTEVRGVDNSCPADLQPHLVNVANTLEKVRKLLGAPIIVTSGYRCAAVNTAVGGAADSAHLQAFAADFICPDFGTPLQICAKIEAAPALIFDQLINEGAKGASLGWVHISIAPPQRRQVLTANFETGKAVYSEGLPTA